MAAISRIANGSTVRATPTRPSLLGITQRRVLELAPERSATPRLLIANRHQTKRITRMRRPVMLGPQAHIAIGVALLVIKPQRLATHLSRRLLEPALRHHPPHRLNPLHRRTTPLIRDRRLNPKPGIAQMIPVALASHRIGNKPVMRQMTHRLLIALRPQLVDVI